MLFDLNPILVKFHELLAPPWDSIFVIVGFLIIVAMIYEASVLFGWAFQRR
jgi:hypothetical protein